MDPGAVVYVERIAHQLRLRPLRALPAVTAVRLCIAETRQQITEVRRQVADVRARITGRVALFGASDVDRVDRYTADIERTNRGTTGPAA